ncbi:MAG TPA: glutamate 5-kinase [Phycisphaerae bacterium]|nr:glutamate 5-kinase [Phycisphaerales bacterium]HNO78959.1 glutamate 5-kinase [Phycisphaerae bacterium]
MTKKTSLIVVKIGSGVLTGVEGLNRPALRRIGSQLVAIRESGRQVVVVSSGAIASGLKPLGLARMPKTIVDKQAAAAVGQQVLMNAWADVFRKSKISVGQVLLTSDDLDNRSRYLNARHTLVSLLHRGVIPIINENDSVSFEEIKMGDNDHLSALVTTLISANLLVMLTNVDGLRRGGANGDLIEMVRADDDVDQHVSQTKSATGVGGMFTKLHAARLVGRSGIPAVIANGSQANVLQRILEGERVGTYFEPQASRLDVRRRWIATATRPRGKILVDDGARAAIVSRNASLLPSGITEIDGHFSAGAVVRICDGKGVPFARGLVSYTSEEARRVMGHNSKDIPDILGYRYLDEIIHRNDLVLDED